MNDFPLRVFVECQAGSLSLIFGRPGPISTKDKLDMVLWKRIVAEVSALNPEIPLHVAYCGAANLITGYRLYYILEYAKRSGIKQVVLHSDGEFWLPEATQWLVESCVDEIILVQPVAEREIEMDKMKRVRGLAKPIVKVGGEGEGYASVQHEACAYSADVAAINWRGEVIACPFDTRAEHVAGRIPDTTVSKAWSAGRRESRERQSRGMSEQLPNFCAECQYREGC